jgi:calcineurin-like phosphoesterase family protein
MSIYIWSDLHLNHDKIRLYENRPFDSEEAMNKAICKSWKETVKKRDTIINLGDVSWRLNKEWMSKTIKNLPGYKILILGNHDRGKSVKWWLDVGFDEVYKYPIIYDGSYILSHEPIYVNDHMPYVNVHGHIHTERSMNKQKYNVSIELLDYKPILFDDIKTYYEDE